MPSQNELRQYITNQIVEALEKGTAPWRRPWTTDKNSGAPANAVSGKSYTGVNPLLLQLASNKHGFTSRYWATFKQWSDLGGQVMKRPSHIPPGQFGTSIVFCRPVTKTTENENGEEKEDRYWTMRSYTVFNIDQVLGTEVDRFRVGTTPVESFEVEERFELAEQVVTASAADIRYGGEKAFYCSEQDFIQMPHRHQFSVPEFWDTLLHECCHWTEHPTRLDWDRSLPENTYALGELIAELGSCFLAGELGLPINETLGNHAAYLQSWLQKMKGDSRWIFRATAQASRAADFIMSFSRVAAPDPEPALV